jgi:hypothetical protein
MKKSILELFPHASQSCRLLNAAPLSRPAEKTSATGEPGGKDRMNKTERVFSFILEAMKRKGEISRYDYEGITLRWKSGKKIIRYTPDFVVFFPAIDVGRRIRLIEVKGPFVKGKFERAIERFRHARTFWGTEFEFQLWQRTHDGWGRPNV